MKLSRVISILAIMLMQAAPAWAYDRVQTKDGASERKRLAQACKGGIARGYHNLGVLLMTDRGGKPDIARGRRGDLHRPTPLSRCPVLFFILTG